MKNLIVLILLLSSATLASAQSQSGKIQTVEIATEIWCDHCAQCESCGQHIYNNIKANKGVRKVDIDSENNLIVVKFNSKKTSSDEIEKAIALAGFKANQREADKEAYQKLDNCCKKN